jgi:hypothetical protein
LESWETQDDIRKTFEAAGFAISQSALARRLERRRDEGLLSVRWHHPKGVRGSETLYPSGTAAQAVEIERPLGKTRKFARVGWDLWWNGFTVDDLHWRPRLERVAKTGDRLLRFLSFFIWRNRPVGSDQTRIDRIAEKGPKQSILAKINRRVGFANLPAMWNILLPVATGQFNSNLDASDQQVLTKTFDFEQSARDRILGKQLKLESALPDVLSELADLAFEGSLSDACKFPENEIEVARDDIRNAINIITDFYAATSWIYGLEAFGLRSAAWVAQNSTPDMKALCVLAFAARRRKSNSMYSSEKIAELARTARTAKENSLALRELQKNPRFAKVLSPERLRRGLKTFDDRWDLLKEIQAARLKRGQRLASVLCNS